MNWLSILHMPSVITVATNDRNQTVGYALMAEDGIGMWCGSSCN
jgi:hypothetical protein